MSEQPSRRVLLRCAAFAGMAAASAVAGGASAQPANTKADVKYQFTPKGSETCNACVSFIPGEGSGAPGTCKVVQGVIPQNGWCVLFSKRRP
jgi:hypothetical protein